MDVHSVRQMMRSKSIYEIPLVTGITEIFFSPQAQRNKIARDKTDIIFFKLKHSYRG